MLRLLRCQGVRVVARPFSTSTPPSVVTIQYADLVAGKDLSAEIDAAYNFEGVGLLTVAGVPELIPLRERLLKLGYKFALMPEATKNKYEHASSFFSFGWSQGKEVLEETEADKGSFYANPIHDVVTEDEETKLAFPSYCSDNIWPDEDLPELKPAFQELGKLIVDVGALVAAQCDRYVHARCPGYDPTTLHKIVTEGKTHKGRLLHYYPPPSVPEAGSAANSSSWCGWHNDHGALTGLTSAMFIDEHGNETSNPDPNSGLHVKTRQAETKRLVYPKDHLAFQIGEAAQILSGGILQATPHAVQGPMVPEALTLSRDTLAVFMQPLWTHSMSLPEGQTVDDAQRGSTHEFLPPGLPPLHTRWDPSYDFGTFTNKTLENYHNMEEIGDGHKS